MNTNIFGNIATTVNPSNDAFLVHLDKTANILCRMMVKNIKIFLELLYYQSNNILNKYDQTSFLEIGAGDIFNNYICLYPTAKNSDNSVLINDKNFAQLAFSFTQIAKTFPQIKMLINEYNDDYPTIMWECCKYFIVPIRLNYQTIPPIEKENVLRKWLSTAFTLPFFNTYTNRFSGSYPNPVTLLQKLYSIFLNIKNGEVSFTNVTDNIEKLDDKVIDTFMGPINSENNMMLISFKMVMTIMLFSSIDIVKKYCPNIKECKQINPNYNGSWIDSFDKTVSEQINNINKIINDIQPK